MTVAIVGSRNCGSLTLECVLENIPPNCTGIVSGGASGVDTLARRAARRLGVPLEEYLPNYEAYGRMAPLVRNRLIVERAELVLAFWDYCSRGTRDALKKALELDKKIKIVLLEQAGEARW